MDDERCWIREQAGRVAGILCLWSFLLSSSALAKCYEYDDLGRLKGVTYDNSGSGATADALAFFLDKHGNRTAVNAVNGTGVSCIAPSGSPTDGITVIPSYSSSSSGSSSGGNNSAPVTDDENISIPINGFQTVLPLGGDSDPDGDNFFLISVSGTPTLFTYFQNGDEVIIQSGATAGAESISYTVSDEHGATSQGSINVTVTNLISICSQVPIPYGCPGYDDGGSSQ